jgi:hypothetical protein
MGELEGNAFAATKRNALSKKGNTNPRRAFNQQAAVELTPEAISWLDERLERSFDTYGQISKAELATLDWPTIKL